MTRPRLMKGMLMFEPRRGWTISKIINLIFSEWTPQRIIRECSKFLRKLKREERTKWMVKNLCLVQSLPGEMLLDVWEGSSGINCRLVGV